MNDLKQKTIAGLSWSFIDTFSRYGITFFISIILARLLSPADFGLVGMTTIFFAISTTFIDSGFGNALIRKKNVTDLDLSSVFYLNIILGFIFFLIIFFSAPLISSFLNEPRLTNLVKAIAVGLIIGSFSSIQQTILTKRIDFKLQTRISVISTLVSGAISITMALRGFGVWSLVFSNLLSRLFATILLWTWNNWKPKWIFSFEVLKELFSFGSKLMVSRLINVAFQNIYYLVIGKYFSATDLGYYTKADGFKKLPSENLTAIVQRVTYPVLSSIQDDPVRLKAAYRKLIRSTMFISFVLMIGMAASAEAMVLTLIGEKWTHSIIYLQLLCFIGMFYPLHAINLNMLNVQGRSDLFLKLEIVKKILVVPVVILGVAFGIKCMILGMLFNNFIALYLNTYWSGKHIDYKIITQIKDILPSFLLAVFMGLLVYLTGQVLQLRPLFEFLIQLFFGASIIIIFCEATRMRDYYYMRQILWEQIRKLRR